MADRSGSGVSMGVGGSAGGAGGVGASGGGGGGGGGGPCGACKFLRRKCVSGCVFAPYFDCEQGALYFAAVHKVFGASNVSKLLLNLPADRRLESIVTICYEAQARLRDPVYGCVSQILALQQQVATLQAEVSCLHAHLATVELPSPLPPLPPSSSLPPVPPSITISDLQSASRLPATFDLATFFDPPLQPLWSLQQQQEQLQQLLQQDQQMDQLPEFGPDSGGGSLENINLGDGDLQSLASELIERHMLASIEPPPPMSN